jgi:hypothetical protein
MSEALVASIATICLFAAMLVDGRAAMPLAAAAAGLGMAPAMDLALGAGGALLPLNSGLAVALASVFSEQLALRLRWTAGIDPLVPVVARAGALFGPRSRRAAAAAWMLPAASWVGFNVRVGGSGVADGVIFAVTYCWLIGVMRVLLAVTVEDLTVGTALVLMAAACTWSVEMGPGMLPAAIATAALAVGAALVSGWLVGRHRRAMRQELP